MKKSDKITGWGNGTAIIAHKTESLWSRLSHDSLVKLIKIYSQVFIGLAGLVSLILLAYLIYQIF